MRVFVTGASGFIGTAVTRELVGAGHHVLGSPAATPGPNWCGRPAAEVVRGDLGDAAGLAAIAREADGVAHLAFIHDFSRFEENILTDRAVVEAITTRSKGSGKPFVLTSGAALAASEGRAAIETDEPGGVHIGRVSRGATELVVRAASEKGRARQRHPPAPGARVERNRLPRRLRQLSDPDRP